MNKKARLSIFLLIIVILISVSLISATENSDEKVCGIYFTYINCPNCEYTDPLVLNEWINENPDLIIIEYFFADWKSENALLLGQYASEYKTTAAVPNLFLDENRIYLGKISVPSAEEKIDAMDKNPCLLLDKKVYFNELDLNELSGEPKIWYKNRFLVKLKDNEISDGFLKELLFSENISKTLEESGYDIEPTESVSAPISGGEITFDKAVSIEDSWLLRYNEETGNSQNNNSNSSGNSQNDTINIPLIGVIDMSGISLPVITAIIGLADGFNPCAFFILTFLLAAMIYAGSEEIDKKKRRLKLLVVGGIFIFFSGLVYFLFMSLWLNVFLYAKQIFLLTLVAGAIALFAGIVNIKDYFYFKRGISLTLPKSGNVKFQERVKKLTQSKSFLLLILGTIIIAATVNLYELLCTVGFPMVYLGTLASNQLSTASYYLYLILYNIFYIIPLAIIVSIFIVTLGKREFGKRNVQRMKLISGFMIFFLGIILIFKPELLENILTPFIAIALAVLISLTIMYLREFRKNREEGFESLEKEANKETEKEDSETEKEPEET